MTSWIGDRNVTLGRFPAAVACISRVHVREHIEAGCWPVTGRLARQAALSLETRETGA